MIDDADVETKAIRFARSYCGEALLGEGFVRQQHEFDDAGQAIDHVVAASIVGFREGLRRQRLERSAPGGEVPQVGSDV